MEISVRFEKQHSGIWCTLKCTVSSPYPLEHIFVDGDEPEDWVGIYPHKDGASIKGKLFESGREAAFWADMVEKEVRRQLEEWSDIPVPQDYIIDTNVPFERHTR